MTMTDPIADMLTRLRNGIMARARLVDVPASKIKVEIAKLLKEEGYIRNFKLIEGVPQATLRVQLKYDSEGKSIISGIERVSRPGKRTYIRKTEVKPVLGGLGINIITTSKGVMTGKQCMAQGVGGEIICRVW